jgi:hypothetical protein
MQRSRDLKRLYGITSFDVMILKMRQNNKCAICLQSKPLVVDHNHKTNRVRALLCHACNKALGHIYDDPVIADAMAAYLRLHGSLTRDSRTLEVPTDSADGSDHQT